MRTNKLNNISNIHPKLENLIFMDGFASIMCFMLFLLLIVGFIILGFGIYSFVGSAFEPFIGGYALLVLMLSIYIPARIYDTWTDKIHRFKWGNNK